MTEHVLSFDVEDYFHVETFRGTVDRAEWGALEGRVQHVTPVLLDMLDAADTRATFFVLAWVADRYPHLVREIAARGHEVASHGYGHELIYRLTPEAFRRDVQRSRDLLRELSGQPVVGYRAPSFSIVGRSLWALDILLECGFEYDSSIFPIRHHRYGIPGFPLEPVRIEWSDDTVLDEYPLATLPLLSYRLPVAGGGYFRLLPAWLLRRAWESLTRAGRRSVFYLHPWELDPEQPRLPLGPLSARRHYGGLHRTRARLETWLARFDWVPFREMRARSGPPALRIPRARLGLPDPPPPRPA